MVYLIYKTTNIVNGKYYIGVHSQSSLEFDGYLGSGTALRKAVRLYGPEQFIRETLHVFDDKETAYQTERNLVDPVYQNTDCYNMHPGGGGYHIDNRGRQVSEQTRQKIRQRMLSDNPNNSPGVREKISKSKRGKPNHKLKGRKYSEERKAEMSRKRKGCKGHIGINNGMFGRHHTVETRAKMSEKRKGLNHRPERNRAVVLNGIAYSSIVEAAAAVGISTTGIRLWCKLGKASYIN